MKNSTLNIKTLTVGPIQACCYIVSSAGNSRAFLIDPGGDGETITDYLQAQGLEPVYLINTHGHIDHIGANQEIKQAYPDIKICVHTDDARMLTNAGANLSPELGYKFTSPQADKLLQEDDLLTIPRAPVRGGSPPGGLTSGKNELALKVIHLPGHTRGGIGLLYTPPAKPEPMVMFTGDTLFAGGIGRTDFPGGSTEQIISSIKEKILTLPDNTIIYPGHGPATTVGNEKLYNPFLGA